LHLSDLHRIPTMALFGPTNNKEWGLRFTKGVEIVSPTGNMHDIAVEQVLDCFDKLTVY
jgi:ADP-heptose:LPS heptosyltransferase